MLKYRNYCTLGKHAIQVKKYILGPQIQNTVMELHLREGKIEEFYMLIILTQ